MKLFKIEVDRYKKEWLYWHHEVSDLDFLHDIFYKIDGGIINIYPLDWVRRSTCVFVAISS